MAKLSAARKDRLGAAAARWRDAQETLNVRRREFQDEVLEAIDADKATHAEVAHAIGVSKTRIYGVIAGAYKGRD